VPAPPASNVSDSITKEEAQALLARIREGMTVREVRGIIPFSTNGLIAAVEHGGIGFEVGIGNCWFIQLRVEHPSAGKGLDDSRVNWAPALIRHW
jgi:hypothetical protein